MYNTELRLTVDAVTPFAAGDDDNKIHGIALKLIGTATAKDEFADLGFGKGVKYLDALLNGDLPVDGDVLLKISDRNDVRIHFIDDDAKFTIPAKIVSISVSPRVGLSWGFTIKTKSEKLSSEQAGKLANMLRTSTHCHFKTSQGEAFKETIHFTRLPDELPSADVIVQKASRIMTLTGEEKKKGKGKKK